MDNFNRTSETRSSGALEVTMNARKMEKRQAQLVAEIRAATPEKPDTQKKSKRSWKNTFLSIFLALR